MKIMKGNMGYEDIPHDRPPMKIKCPQDMPVGEMDAGKMKRPKEGNKGYSDMAKQKVKMDY